MADNREVLDEGIGCQSGLNKQWVIGGEKSVGFDDRDIGIDGSAQQDGGFIGSNQGTMPNLRGGERLAGAEGRRHSQGGFAATFAESSFGVVIVRSSVTVTNKVETHERSGDLSEVEKSPHFLDDGAESEGTREDTLTFQGDESEGGGILTGGDEHGNLRRIAQQFFHEFSIFGFSVILIGDHQMHGLVVAPQLMQGLGGAGEIANRIPVGRENAGDHFADNIIVFDQDEVFTTTGLRKRDEGAGGGGSWFVMSWEKHLKRRPLTGSTFGDDLTSALRDNPVGEGESESSAEALAFGREKRFKNDSSSSLIHAATVIRNTEGNVIARVGVGNAKILPGLDGAILSRNNDLAAGRGGIAGIDAEVEDDLLDLNRIDEDVFRVGIEIKFEGALFSADAGEDVGVFRHESIGLDEAGFQFLAPAEGEKLTHEDGRALRRLMDREDFVAAFAFRADGFVKYFTVAVDDGKEVIEVVRQAAGEPPNGIKALRMNEGVL